MIVGVKRNSPHAGRSIALLMILVLLPGCIGASTGGAGARRGPAIDRPAWQKEEPKRPLPVAGKVVPAERGIYQGVYRPASPFSVRNIDAFDAMVRKRTAIVMWYQPWSPRGRYRFDRAACVAVMRRGKIPMITWEPWDPGGPKRRLKDPGNQPRFKLSNIIQGRFDRYIRSWARGIKSIGGPVMLRPMHEMNGNWYPWAGFANGNSPKEFRQAWRHIYDIFERERVTNVTWVWSINHYGVPKVPGNSYATYYPGDRYVDWTAISGFNWGLASTWSRWHTFNSWYDPPLKFLEKLGKPIVIAEMGTVEQGGSKAAWLLDAYSEMKRHPMIKGAIYYDARQRSAGRVQDWRVTTSDSSLEAYRKAIADPYYLQGPPEMLYEWLRSLDDRHWLYLTSFKAIY